MASQRSATTLWTLVGCAGFSVTLLCVAAGVGYAIVADEDKGSGVSIGGGGGGGGGGSQGSPPTSRRVRAIVESGLGSLPVPPQTHCDFTIQPRARPDGTYWCNAQIVCGGRLLYGGPNSGFFPCTLDDGPDRHVVGADPQTTAADTDAAMEIDSRQGRLRIRDDATGRYGRYDLTARILGVW